MNDENKEAKAREPNNKSMIGILHQKIFQQNHQKKAQKNY